MDIHLIRLGIAAIIGACPIAHAAQEVLFSDLFGQEALGNTIVIQVPSDTTLIFDKDGPFTTGGRVLIVYASTAVIRANTIINSFVSQSTIPPPPGTPATPPDQTGQEATGAKGNMGGPGNPGRDCRQVVLGIDTIAADPGKTLTLNAFGEKGGPGQQGANGGRGGPGRPGGNAGGFPCSHPCPESGTRGGMGGPAGAGGPGARGGTGGAVFLSAALFQMYTTGNPALSVHIDGGPGGDAGAPGQGGLGGPGGVRGAGSSTCVCSDPPPPGPDGYRGSGPVDVTPDPQSSQKGSVALYN